MQISYNIISSNKLYNLELTLSQDIFSVDQLGWSFTFMKKGLRLFLLYLYRGNDELPIGLRHMCKDVVSDLAFSEKRYCRGLRDSKDK